jgi:pilus assembly protein Flp/PilA
VKYALFNLLARLKQVLEEENGQDLVEYALVVALVAFGATAGTKALGTGINTMFNHISTTLAAQ